MGEYLFWDGNYADDDRPEDEAPDADAMNEPTPYTGELDWSEDGSELLHPFID